MGRSQRKIPIDWEKYSPIGSVIQGTRIFAFKTPLKPELQDRICKSKRFTTLDLFRMMEGSGKSIGLVINCSNTKRYYDAQDILGMSVEYKELPCPGRGFLVRTDLVKDFIQIIDDFLDRNSDNDLLIGVHCSDGINRSGYLVCCYLICKLGWSSHDALNAFENARRSPIQRGSYIQSLHKTDSDRRASSTLTSRRPNVFADGTAEKTLTSLFEQEAAASSMQQFFQLEQQFKQVASSTFPDLNTFSPAPLPIPQRSNIPAASSIQQVSSSLDTARERSDNEDDNSQSSNIDFESMGKVLPKEAVSKSQLRRERRQRREKMFSVMKRGRFWEINEMRDAMKNN
ncbi:hypothetical protein ACQ4LE_003067 [Meloidogyne hapla]|uniref:TYR_PHOSPHATASE_2 domain-containing protein n=1 Tax=Meloidogyne hapla TaxID=6305 RepID=A0A1I8BRB0_MELHA